MCAPGCAQIEYERGRRSCSRATPTGTGRFAGWTGVCAGAGSTCVIRASAPPSGGYRAVAAHLQLTSAAPVNQPVVSSTAGSSYFRAPGR